METMITEQEFQQLCRSHDLTYEFSEGPNYYNGREEFLRIEDLAKTLPRKKAVQIWNNIVELKLRGPARERFYWYV